MINKLFFEGDDFMDDFNNKILTALKRKFVAIKPECKFDSIMASSKREFYLSNLDDNLFQPMTKEHLMQYSDGSGNELNQKMRALHSSSAMTVNLLGNHSIVFKENPIVSEGTYSIEYEKRLRTLNISGQPANLDAQLLCPEEETAIFCEMKMTEWLNSSPGKLKNAYLEQENYFYPESFAPFNRVFQSLIDSRAANGSDNKSIYKRYDAFQMIKHMLGIYNEMCNGEHNEFNKIRLINCVWKIEDCLNLGERASDIYMKLYSKFISEFEDFKKKIQPIILLFSEKNIDFDIIFMSFDEFLNIVKKSDQELAYLERYECF